MPSLSTFSCLLRRTSRALSLCLVVGAGLLSAYLIGPSKLPFSVQRIKDVSGSRPLDVMFAYSANEGAAALDALGTAGRRHYWYFLVADAGFLVIYTLALASLLFALFGRGRWALAVASVPAVAGLFDALEDAGEVIALSMVPNSPLVVLWATSALGVVKHIAIYGALLLLLPVGLVLALLRFIKRRGNDGAP
ncbi:hypothetical protein SAMN04488564_111324 [Lentzea waywayandensis]|uniref:Uncharacterized protein n=1 Tax=Lentzea waywayandensis TaxID=84724 RepID=A0A1I6FD88_9PSEU|nr:hypothetical protein [Lentzea waywayandensis]SFR27884.1 hypothetical protein SAMN04488564_111324 [Lentzea waywayandensis]